MANGCSLLSDIRKTGRPQDVVTGHLISSRENAAADPREGPEAGPLILPAASQSPAKSSPSSPREGAGLRQQRGFSPGLHPPSMVTTAVGLSLLKYHRDFQKAASVVVLI